MARQLVLYGKALVPELDPDAFVRAILVLCSVATLCATIPMSPSRPRQAPNHTVQGKLGRYALFRESIWPSRDAGCVSDPARQPRLP